MASSTDLDDIYVCDSDSVSNSSSSADGEDEDALNAQLDQFWFKSNLIYNLIW